MKRSFCIEKLVGLNLPKENIRGFEPDPNASKNQSNKDKEDNNAIQLTKTKTDTTNRSVTVLVQDVRVKIMTDALIDN
jgi:hypothetical protein